MHPTQCSRVPTSQQKCATGRTRAGLEEKRTKHTRLDGQRSSLRRVYSAVAPLQQRTANTAGLYKPHISGSEAGLVYLRHTSPLERLQETNRNLPWPGTISMTLLARSVWPCTVCPSMPAMIFLVPSLPAHTTRAILPAGEYFRSFSSRVHALTVAY